MLNTALAQQLDKVWGDPATWTADGLHWVHLPAVRRAICRRVTGNESVDPLSWFFNRVAAEATLPLGRVLVLGCGTAANERTLCERGWTREAVAFDLSAMAVKSARASASDLPAVQYVQADMDNLPVGHEPFLPGSYDAVLGIASVHHGSRLPRLFANLRQLLVPGGWLFLNEYVGPDRFQFPDAQARHIARVAATLPQPLMTTLQGAHKHGFKAPSVEEVIAVDPSEAVASSQILPLMDHHFETVLYRPYGGALLHFLLGNVAQNFLGPAGETLAETLVAVEDELYRQHALSHDFACVIARARL